MSTTFADKYAGRRNAFGLLRLLFASLVIVSHAFPNGGFGHDPFFALWHEQTDLGNLGVLGFFVISGYLITKSAQRSDILTYMWHRMLRIYPAFIAVLLAGAFVIGPWFFARQHGSLDGYFAGPEGPLQYLRYNIGLHIGQYGIHDVFTGEPYGQLEGASVINGSLWSLSFEFLCYEIVGILAVLGLLTRARWVVPAMVIGLSTINGAQAYIPGFDVAREKHQIIALTATFLLGATVALYADKIPYRDRWAVLAAAVAGLTAFTTGFAVVGYAALAYLVLWAAVRLPVSTYRIGSRNDISYGIYVWGWPVLASLAAYQVPQRFGYLPYLVAAFALTVPLGWLSWVAVERPAMSVKDRGPGRGIAWSREWIATQVRRVRRRDLEPLKR